MGWAAMCHSGPRLHPPGCKLARFNNPCRRRLQVKLDRSKASSHTKCTRDGGGA